VFADRGGKRQPGGRHYVSTRRHRG
jgi:hypothetical protein